MSELVKWAVLVAVVASWCAVARLFRLSAQQDARVRVAMDEETRRRRALEAVAKPLSEHWRLNQGYAKDGRDHR